MKKIFYNVLIMAVLLGGMVVGMLKGQDAKQKWISKMKFKYEDKKHHHRNSHPDPSMLTLDDIEIATYHS